MDRFDRQRRIAGWNQERLEQSTVLVCGRGWLGAFTVWGLASMGIGRILWVGKPVEATDPLANWFLAEPSPFAGTAIHDYPLDVEYGSELTWIEAGTRLDVVLACPEDRVAHGLCWRFAAERRAAFHGATGTGGGWIGSTVPVLEGDEARSHPATALVAAALLVDAVREALAPLHGGRLAAGRLALDPPASCGDTSCRLVGVGGIGVYVATLAAVLGMPALLIDDDRVDATNLNRQGLFRAADVTRRAWKAVAAADVLRSLFPRSRLRAETRRADDRIGDLLVRERTSLVLSAVDNAASRLLLQDAGRRHGAHVVQGGTDVFVADVYTQGTEGPRLDEQMRGAMTRGRTQEGARRGSRGAGCAGDPSYVVPGMIAAGLMVHRALAAGRSRDPAPLHWRTGAVPVEGRTADDGFDFSGITVA